MTETKRKILVIDDDRLTAQIYRNKFQSSGYDVEVALDGQEGFFSAMASRPDAILLDLLLPQISGLELLKKLRAQSRFKHLPVFVLTNSFLGEMAQQAGEYANKMFDKARCRPQDLVEAVQEVIGGGEVKKAGASLGAEAAGGEGSGSGAQTGGLSAQGGEKPAGAGASAVEAEKKPLESSSGSGAGGESSLSSDDFRRRLPPWLAGLRQALRGYTSIKEMEGRQQSLLELKKLVHGLTSQAGAFGFQVLAHFSSVYEALVWELHAKPEQISASTDRTLAYGLDCLSAMAQELGDKEDLSGTPSNILVVDDEVISRKAAGAALAKVHLQYVAVGEAASALELLEENAFDLAVLDVHLPDVDGFDLCKQIRSLPLHKTTPVIFVTGANTFESRARSIVSGGNDFISKPFLLLDLGLKALAQVVMHRRKRGKEGGIAAANPSGLNGEKGAAFAGRDMLAKP